MKLTLNNGGGSQDIKKNKSTYIFESIYTCNYVDVEGLPNNMDTDYNVIVKSELPTTISAAQNILDCIVSATHQHLVMPNKRAYFNSDKVAYVNYTATTINDTVTYESNLEGVVWKNNQLTIPSNTTDQSREITVTFINGNKTVTVTFTQEAKKSSIINYEAIPLLSYDNDTIDASGGTAIANAAYTIKAIYDDGTKKEVTSYPQVTETFTATQGNINEYGDVTYSSRGNNVGDIITSITTYEVSIEGYSSYTATANTYQTANNVISENFDENSLKLSWSATEPITAKTVDKTAHEEQLYATMNLVTVYTSGTEQTLPQQLTITD